MVQINVSQQLQAPIGSTRDYELNEIMDIAGSNSLVQGEIGLMRTDRSILAKGTLNTEITLTCSRCLSSFSYPLTLNIEEEYFPVADAVTDTSLPLTDEPGGFTIDEHSTLDLTEAIRQYALLATPMKPLCQEDCTGLCPACGQNLNQALCDCPPQPIDLRWSRLHELALADNDVSVNEPKGTE